MAWWDPPREKRSHTFSGAKGAQIKTELDAFVAFMRVAGVRRYCEIGGKLGDTFHQIMLALPKGARGVLVDRPSRPANRMQMETAVADLRRRGMDVHLFVGASQEPATIAGVEALGPFDMVFLDGDRHREALWADWNTYGALSRFVALHDIHAAGARLDLAKSRGDDMCAPELWAQWRRDGLKTWEFTDRAEHVGIGVVELRCS